MVRERILIRKRVVHESEQIDTTLRRELIEVVANEGVTIECISNGTIGPVTGPGRCRTRT